MNIFYFNDLGYYDEFNPSYYLDKEYSKDLIKYISKEPFKESRDSLKEKVNIGNIDILDGLVKINALSIKDGKYKVNFPVFYEEDVKLICNIVNDNINSLIDKIKSILKDYSYSKEELYHIVCNNIFDNYSLDYLMNKGLITNNKINPGNRDYIIIGYEDSPFVNDYSNKLLCSNNRLRCKNIIFNSFGDANGERKDFFRYFRLKEQGKNKFKEIDDYMISIDNDKDILINNLEDCFNGKGDINTIKLLNYLGYMKDNKICVPILKNNGYNDLGLKIMDNILEDIKVLFNKVSTLDITPNKNDVPIKDTLNEVWHIIFGLINKRLVEEGIVATPNYIDGEGTYFRCIYIDQ